MAIGRARAAVRFTLAVPLRGSRSGRDQCGRTIPSTAAPGADGQTGQSYKQDPEINLAELHYIIFLLGHFLMRKKTSHRRSLHSVRFGIRGSGPQ
jgi:hypothetical protein